MSATEADATARQHPVGSDEDVESQHPVHLQVNSICKSFGGARALADVTLDLRRAEVHCLVGENGAGKSTLGKILAGVQMQDSGSIRVEGREVHFRSPKDAIAAGTAFIAQELSIVPYRSVMENVFLGSPATRRGLVSTKAMKAKFDELQERTGFLLDPDVLAGTLALSDQQKVEILRALAREAKLVVMDEPTAALGPSDTNQLLDIIRDLRSRGVTVIFVTHFLSEALAVADRITVLKDGKIVSTSNAEEESADSLITKMLGQPLDSMFPEKSSARGPQPVLQVNGVSTDHGSTDISFDVFPGEIVGIAGLVGSGRTELLRALVGIDHVSAGTVEVGGSSGPFRSPREAQKSGMVLVPESRKDQGLILRASVLDNVGLPHLSSMSRGGFMRKRRLRQAVKESLRSVSMDPRRIDSPVGDLSGGNQQKVLFAKWLLSKPDVLIADEPTRGVDVGARATLYATLRQLASEGMAILFVSSDNDEVIGLADRVIVMRERRIEAVLEGEAINEHQILQAMLNYDTHGQVNP